MGLPQGLGNVVLVVTAFATFFFAAIIWYTQILGYPLWRYVGRDEFLPLHREYLRRLPLIVQLPYGLLMASNTLLLFYRPMSVSQTWSVTSVAFASRHPHHQRRHGRTDPWAVLSGRILRGPKTEAFGRLQCSPNDHHGDQQRHDAVCTCAPSRLEQIVTRCVTSQYSQLVDSSSEFLFFVLHHLFVRMGRGGRWKRDAGVHFR